MMCDESVTQWIADIQAGKGQAGKGGVDAAQRELWDRYFQRLIALARQRLTGVPRGAEDEEDVAISALKSFFGGVERDRFPHLEDRHNLWSLLASITARKAINQRKRQLAAKRGGGQVRGERTGERGTERGARLADLVDRELQPDDLAAMSEECRRLMGLLQDVTLERVARMKLEGYTNEEISRALGVAGRTVERKLSLIRRTWSKVNPADES